MTQAKYYNKQQLIDLGIIDVDSEGNWIKISTGKINKAHNCQTGYKNFTWRFNKKTYNMSVHRCVYLWFKESIPEGYHIDHINHDGWDNRIENLRALPASLNIRLTLPRGKRIRKPSEAAKKIINAARKAWYQEHREQHKAKTKATNKAWREAHPDYMREYQRKYRQRKKLEKANNI